MLSHPIKRAKLVPDLVYAQEHRPLGLHTTCHLSACKTQIADFEGGRMPASRAPTGESVAGRKIGREKVLAMAPLRKLASEEIWDRWEERGSSTWQWASQQIFKYTET